MFSGTSLSYLQWQLQPFTSTIGMFGQSTGLLREPCSGLYLFLDMIGNSSFDSAASAFCTLLRIFCICLLFNWNELWVGRAFKDCIFSDVFDFGLNTVAMEAFQTVACSILLWGIFCILQFLYLIMDGGFLCLVHC